MTRKLVLGKLEFLTWNISRKYDTMTVSMCTSIPVVAFLCWSVSTSGACIDLIAVSDHCQLPTQAWLHEWFNWDTQPVTGCPYSYRNLLSIHDNPIPPVTAAYLQLLKHFLKSRIWEPRFLTAPHKHHILHLITTRKRLLNVSYCWEKSFNHE